MPSRLYFPLSLLPSSVHGQWRVLEGFSEGWERIWCVYSPVHALHSWSMKIWRGYSEQLQDNVQTGRTTTIERRTFAWCELTSTYYTSNLFFIILVCCLHLDAIFVTIILHTIHTHKIRGVCPSHS